MCAAKCIFRAFVIGVVIFVALFAARFFFWQAQTSNEDYRTGSSPAFEMSRKNYASEKTAMKEPSAPSLGDTQKFEKIASVSQVSEHYDADLTSLRGAIEERKGVVQYERSSGLSGRRSLNLGIGIPPEKFDEFVAAVQKIGRVTSIEIQKNDKTNDYLELKAKRASLEKTRASIEALTAIQASVEERLQIQARLTELDEQLQALGISLGDFDVQNEFCTVKLSLIEKAAPRPISLARRAFDALEWTVSVYIFGALGLLLMTGALWIGMAALRTLLAFGREYRARPKPASHPAPQSMS